MLYETIHFLYVIVEIAENFFFLWYSTKFFDFLSHQTQQGLSCRVFSSLMVGFPFFCWLRKRLFTTFIVFIVVVIVLLSGKITFLLYFSFVGLFGSGFESCGSTLRRGGFWFLRFLRCRTVGDKKKENEGLATWLLTERRIYMAKVMVFKLGSKFSSSKVCGRKTASSFFMFCCVSYKKDWILI